MSLITKNAAVLWLLLGLLLLLVVHGVLGGMGPYISGALMLAFIFFFTISYELKKRRSDITNISSSTVDVARSDDLQTPLSDSTFTSNSFNSKQDQKHKHRVLYLDNLKVFLTIIVVMHHTCICFYQRFNINVWIMGVGVYKTAFAVFGGRVIVPFSSSSIRQYHTYLTSLSIFHLFIDQVGSLL